MCSVAAASIAAVVGSALAQGVQNDRNLSSQADAARENAKRADAARGDAYCRANEQVGQIQRQYADAEGAQKTAMASSGFSLDSGSYLDILAGTAGAKDYETANAYANAAREALGMGREADDFRKQAQAFEEDRIWNAGATLVGGASQTASAWNQQKARRGS